MTTLRNLLTKQPIRCCDCGPEHIASVAPGTMPDIDVASDTMTDRGAVMKAWCWDHAPWLRGYQGVLGL